jgi:hypothetical protein
MEPGAGESKRNITSVTPCLFDQFYIAHVTV